MYRRLESAHVRLAPDDVKTARNRPGFTGLDCYVGVIA